MTNSEQLALPLDVRPRSEVRWLNCVQTVKKRRLLKDRVSVELITSCGSADQTIINTDDIAKVKDPDLRYALRFAAAAAAVGWSEDQPGAHSLHEVRIDATAAGFDSTLLRAWYSGVTSAHNDTFLENLHTANITSQLK